MTDDATDALECFYLLKKSNTLLQDHLFSHNNYFRIDMVRAMERYFKNILVSKPELSDESKKLLNDLIGKMDSIASNGYTIGIDVTLSNIIHNKETRSILKQLL